MSPTERFPFSYKCIKVAKLNFESDEDSSDENELTDSESVTSTDFENLNSYGEAEDGNVEEEEKEDDDEGVKEVEEELDVTPISRFSSMDYSAKLNTIRRQLFIVNVRRRLFSYNFEEEDSED